MSSSAVSGFWQKAVQRISKDIFTAYVGFKTITRTLSVVYATYCCYISSVALLIKIVI